MIAIILMSALLFQGTYMKPAIYSEHISQPIKVDGFIDRQWEAAREVGLVYNNGPYLGKTPAWDTQVKSLWNNDNLYFLFKCKSKNPKPFYQTRDCGLWNDPDKYDIAEVLIDPEGKGREYFEINVNSGGGSLDCRVTYKNKERKWDKTWPLTPLKIKTRLVNNENGFDGWICEIAIPWKSISSSPKAGKSIKVNLFRADNDLPTPYLAFSPTGIPSFHVPEKFGMLICEKHD